jgi:FixJ family two-component response regulator
MAPASEARAPRPGVLIVDDDRAVVEALKDTLEPEFDAIAVTRPEVALATLAQRDVAVLVADQRMPGMEGVAVLVEARQRNPDVVGVLMTAYADIDAAVQAINDAHAFAFVTKPWDTEELLGIVRRAVDAHRRRRRERGDLHDQQQRELAGLEQLSRATPAPVTARRFGSAPLRERAPTDFSRLLDRYTQVLDRALEQRVYRVDNRISESLGSLADELGTLRAGPRDVVDLHTTALRARLQQPNLSTQVSEAWAAEGRLLILELMGYLVSYYRAYTLGLNS